MKSDISQVVKNLYDMATNDVMATITVMTIVINTIILVLKKNKSSIKLEVMVFVIGLVIMPWLAPRGDQGLSLFMQGWYIFSHIVCALLFGGIRIRR